MAGETTVDPALAGTPEIPFGQSPSSTATLLPRILDLTQATPLRATLLGHRSLMLDAEQVERMSTPCVQVLLAAARSAGAFRIVNASAVFRAGLADLGLQAEFGKWMD